MKPILMTLYVSLLFFILTPGVLVVLPPNMMGQPNALYIVAATHALIFGIVYQLTSKMVWRTFYPKRKPKSNKKSFKKSSNKSSSESSSEVQP